MLKKIKLYQFLLFFNVFIILALLLLEAYTPPDFLYQTLHLSTDFLIIFSLALHAFLAFKQRDALPGVPIRVLTVISFFVILASNIKYYLEETMYANFVYSNIHIHPDTFRYLPIYLWCLTVVTLFIQVKTKFSKILIFLPLYFFLLLFLLRFSFFPTFLTLGDEDHIIEWMSSFAFFALSIVSIKALLKFRQHVFLVGVFALIAITSFFIAGEEISWGQRLLGIESSEYFLTENVQNETNLHNLNSVQHLMGLGYLLIGLAGSLSFLLKKHIKQVQLKAMFPNISFIFYFLPLVLYGFVRTFVGPIQYKTWEESIELVLAVGLLIHFYSVQRELKEFEVKSTKS